MSYKKYLGLLAIPIFCLFLMTAESVTAAGAPFTWNSYPSTINKGQTITLSATFVNNTGAPITGSACAIRSSFEKDTSAKMGGALYNKYGNSTESEFANTPDPVTTFSYASTVLRNPSVAHGTTYSINFGFSPDYSVPDGVSATLVAQAKLSENNKFANPGDVIVAYADCYNNYGGVFSVVRTATPAKITVAGLSAAPATTAPSTSTPKKSQAPTPTTEPTAPTAPSLLSVKSGNTDIPTDKPMEFTEGEPITISGLTSPKAIVTIYLFSDPQKFTTTADDNGVWSYTLTNVPPGDHHIEAEVTDPTTNKTSERKQLLAFVVKPAVIAQSGAKALRNKNSLPERFVPLFILLFIPIWLGVAMLLTQGGPWAVLAKLYPAGSTHTDNIRHWQSGKLGGGLVWYRNILNVGITDGGLYLSVAKLFALRQTPLLIPWDKITLGDKKRFFSALHIELETGKSLTVLLPNKIVDAARTKLSPGEIKLG